jgi:hypothetical protein
MRKVLDQPQITNCQKLNLYISPIDMLDMADSSAAWRRGQSVSLGCALFRVSCVRSNQFVSIPRTTELMRGVHLAVYFLNLPVGVRRQNILGVVARPSRATHDTSMPSSVPEEFAHAAPEHF